MMLIAARHLQVKWGGWLFVPGRLLKERWFDEFLNAFLVINYPGALVACPIFVERGSQLRIGDS